MTKAQAIEELTRAAELCPTTPLAEACRTLIALMVQPHDCGTCRQAAQLSNKEPCASCTYAWDGTPSNWEPKEVDNGKTD